MCLRGNEADEEKDKYKSASWSEEESDLQNHIGLLISDKCEKKRKSQRKMKSLWKVLK